ncbi:MAG: hypothetical protein NZM12_11110 [Steroidobacteraceae bacterium]|nr:hypothetical protein [Steroidobacteraceae bacterium]MDW8257838.1 hypothetical protein [Gammaproteobacteria bacterium]
MVKAAHVVYLGLISGMGVLREFAFAGSRYRSGASFDEIVDQRTGKHYFSEALIVGERKQ